MAHVAWDRPELQHSPGAVPFPVSDLWPVKGPRRIRVGLLGCGRIGQAVLATARSEADRLRAAGVELTFIRALVRDLAKPRAARAPLVGAGGSFDLEDLDVVVEVLGGLEPARTLVLRALERGVPVVTANKTLVAQAGAELERAARRHHTALAYDAAVLAGVPFLGSLARRPLLSGAHQITGIVNGTSHAITSALEAGVAFADALNEAIRLGYAEPDSRADISGRDAAEKLTILLRLSGVADADVRQLTTVGIDRLTGEDFLAAEALGGTIKPVAIASLTPGRSGAYVGPAFVERRHPLGAVRGVTNVLQIRGAAGRHAVDVPDVIFQGPGAGPAVTAATIIDDVVEVLHASPTGRTAAVRPRCDLRQPPAGAWFVRGCAASSARADGLDLLSSLGVPTTRSDQKGTWIAALTGQATWGEIGAAVTRLAARGVAAVAWPACEAC